MAYGLQFRGTDKDRGGGTAEASFIIDRTLPTVVVLEKFSISGIGSGQLQWAFNFAGGNYTTRVSLNGGSGYTTPPYIAIRNSSGAVLTRPVLNSNGLNFDSAVFSTTSTSSALEVIILGSSNDAAAINTIESGATYGLELKDDAGVTTYDSRWTNQAVVTEVINFDSSVAVTRANTPAYATTATTVSHTQVDSLPKYTDAFFVLQGVSGQVDYPPGLIDQGRVEAGGGLMAPSVRVISSTQFDMSSQRIRGGSGTPINSGQTTQTPFNGVVIIVRHLNF